MVSVRMAPTDIKIKEGSIMRFRLLPLTFLLLSALLLIGWPTDQQKSQLVGQMGLAHSEQGAWSEGMGMSTEVKLLASDRSREQYFGASVSLSGELALVGAPNDDDNGIDSGAAYIYRWNGSSWQEEAKLTASDGGEQDIFGNAVSLSGEVALVGAISSNRTHAGAAYVFRFDGSTWQEEAKLTASDGEIGDIFGQSVSISCEVAIVAAALDRNGSSIGSAYIFRRSEDGNSWQEESKLTFEDGAGLDWFGESVSIDGDVALIGASPAEAAYLYRWNGHQWQLEQKILADDGESRDDFGDSVSLSGDVALIGAPNDRSIGEGSGSAYLFRFDGESWQQEQKLDHESEQNSFGSSVSISGSMALVGSYNQTAVVYRLSDNGWQKEAHLQPSDGGAASLANRCRLMVRWPSLGLPAQTMLSQVRRRDQRTSIICLAAMYQTSRSFRRVSKKRLTIKRAPSR